MVELDTNIILALIGLGSASIGAMVWTIRQLLKGNDNLLNHNDKFRETLDNHFKTENDTLLKIRDSLEKINLAFSVWETRWQEAKWNFKGK